MNQEKYIGMDVHQATISVAVMDAGGKLIMECLLETKADTIVEFIQGLQGTLSLVARLAVIFHEGQPTLRCSRPRGSTFGILHYFSVIIHDPRRTAPPSFQ